METYYKRITIITAVTLVVVFMMHIRKPSHLRVLVSKNPTSTQFNLLNDMNGLKETTGVEWTPYMDFVEEAVLMKDTPFNYLRKAIDSNLTQVNLMQSSRVFTIGEEIRLYVTLFDGYGKVRVKGGDQLRVRIFEEKLGAYASGYVVEHYNGSYTAVVRALWRGKPKVEINIGCPREVARAWYHTMITTQGTRLYLARYRKSKQEWLCHPFLRRITDTSNFYCNRTKENGGMSLYCARPENISCKDFDGLIERWAKQPKPFTEAENILTDRLDSVLKVIEVEVNGSLPTIQEGHALSRCSSYDPTKLWLLPSPVGYFFKWSWRTLHCKILSNKDINDCLKDKHLVFLGDSTIRQWFEYIQKAYDCQLITNLESYKQCYCDKIKLAIDFSFSAIPGHYMVKEKPINSIPNLITEFANQTESVIVFHQQVHPSSNHPDVFRDRMKTIRKSIEQILKINKTVRLYLKGPHTFRDKPWFGDYFGFVYRAIMLDVFDGLYTNVIYLDSKDMTIATKQSRFHPNPIVVKAMVKQFLSYVC